jgi:mediator of RNA polymerase II transcription subunit 13
MLTVGKSDAVMQILPSALRFWEKLGLGPRAGKKNVTAFVLFEDDGDEKQHQVERWLNSMSVTYAVSIF